jgi:MoxR-like ATPase
MQEKQVTAGNKTYDLDDPFFVMATQNPIDQEGTYPLPEAQTDRFMMKVKLDYPDQRDEEEIVNRFTSTLDFDPELEQVLSEKSVIKLQQFTRQVPIADDIRDRAVELAAATRSHDELEFGASPRGSMNLVLAGKARALIQGRDYVSAEDINEMAIPVLRHRIGLSFQAEKQGKTPEDIVEDIVQKT